MVNCANLRVGYEEDFEETFEIPPQYRRDGWYFHKSNGLSVCWFEVGGRAWKSDPKTFEYKLSIINAFERYTPDLYDTLSKMIRYGLATRQQRDLFYSMRDAIEIRNTYRDSIRVCMPWRKRRHVGTGSQSRKLTPAAVK